MEGKDANIPSDSRGEMFGGPEFPSERTHHEEGKLRRRFGQDVGGIRKRDFVLVGSGAADVINPTANCATTLSVPAPAAKTSASIGSRSVVIRPSHARLHLSTIKLFGGASGRG